MISYIQAMSRLQRCSQLGGCNAADICLKGYPLLIFRMLALHHARCSLFGTAIVFSHRTQQSQMMRYTDTEYLTPLLHTG